MDKVTALEIRITVQDDEVQRLTADIAKLEKSVTKLEGTADKSLLDRLNQDAQKLRDELRIVTSSFGKLGATISESTDNDRLKEQQLLLSEINSEIKRLQGNDEELGYVKQLRQEQDLINTNIQALRQFNSLQEASNVQTGSVDKLAQAYRDLESRIERANIAIRGTGELSTRSIIDLRQEVEKLDRAYDSLSDTNKEGVLGRELANSAKAIAKELRIAGDEADELDRKLKDTGRTNQPSTQPSQSPIQAPVQVPTLLTNQSARSIEELEEKIKELTLAIKQLSEEERKGDIGKRLSKNLKVVNRDLSLANKQAGLLSGRNSGFGKLRTFTTELAGEFGSLGSILRGGALIGGAIAIGEAIRGVARFTRESIDTFAEFQQSIATLGAVSQATASELLVLENQARSIGASTQFTATQIADTQIAFARLGFSAQEIVASIADVANLSIATGESIEKSAKVIGQNIRAYGLAAEDAGQVTDQLTLAFNSSALRLDSFAEASKLLAPTAATLGVSFSESLTAIAKLADVGIEGTLATRTLASAFSRLSDETKKQRKESEALGLVLFDEGNFVGITETIREFNKATSDSTEEQRQAAAARVFGIEAVKNFISLANLETRSIENNNIVIRRGADVLEEYNDRLDAANQTAAATARIVGDTLAQDFLKLNSAIEGLQINFIDQFDESLRSAVQGLTSFIGLISDFIGQPIEDKISEQNNELNGLVETLIRTRDEEDIQIETIARLEAKFSDFSKVVDLSTSSEEQLRAALSQSNSQYETRLRTLRLTQDLLDAQKDKEEGVIDAVTVQAEKLGLLAEARRELRDEYGIDTELFTDDEVLQALRENSDITIDIKTDNTRLSETARLLVNIEDKESELLRVKEEQLDFEEKLADARSGTALSFDALFREQSGRVLEVAEAATELDFTYKQVGISVESINREIKVAQDEIDDTTKKADKLKESGDENSIAYEKFTQKIANLNAEISNLTFGRIELFDVPALQKQLEGLTKQLGETQDPVLISSINKDIEDVKASLAALGETARKSGTDTGRTFQELQTDLSNAQKALQNLLASGTATPEQIAAARAEYNRLKREVEAITGAVKKNTAAIKDLFQQLQEQATNTANSIRVGILQNINAGRAFNEGLDGQIGKLQELNDKIEETQDQFKLLTIGDLDSVEGLNAQISILNRKLGETSDTAKLLDLQKDFIPLQEQLEATKAAAEQLRIALQDPYKVEIQGIEGNLAERLREISESALSADADQILSLDFEVETAEAEAEIASLETKLAELEKERSAQIDLRVNAGFSEEDATRIVDREINEVQTEINTKTLESERKTQEELIRIRTEANNRIAEEELQKKRESIETIEELTIAEEEIRITNELANIDLLLDANNRKFLTEQEQNKILDEQRKLIAQNRQNELSKEVLAINKRYDEEVARLQFAFTQESSFILENTKNKNKADKQYTKLKDKLDEDISKLEINRDLEVNDANDVLINDSYQKQIENSNAAFDADKKNLDSTFEKYKEQVEKSKELIAEIASAFGDIAGEFFDFRLAQIDTQEEAAKESIEREYELRFEEAEGNSRLLEELEREKQARIAAIEKEAAEERKRIALAEAVINTALAVIKALPNPLAAAAAALAGALQIATINAQQFFDGGFVKSRAEVEAKALNVPVNWVYPSVFKDGGKVVEMRKEYREAQTAKRVPMFNNGGRVMQKVNTAIPYRLVDGGIVTATPNIPTLDGGDNILIAVGGGETIWTKAHREKAIDIYGEDVIGRIIEDKPIRVSTKIPKFMDGGFVGNIPSVVNPNNVIGTTTVISRIDKSDMEALGNIVSEMIDLKLTQSTITTAEVAAQIVVDGITDAIAETRRVERVNAA